MSWSSVLENQSGILVHLDPLQSPDACVDVFFMFSFDFSQLFDVFSCDFAVMFVLDSIDCLLCVLQGCLYFLSL